MLTTEGISCVHTNCSDQLQQIAFPFQFDVFINVTAYMFVYSQKTQQVFLLVNFNKVLRISS